MSDLKTMYSTLQADPFPERLTLRVGEQECILNKRTWQIDGQVRGLRYGENPDQPAALYELASGSLAIGGIAFRAPGQGIVSALTEDRMLRSGKHPGKTNLTDVDNGVNILQYLEAKPACVILKHNNPCGAAWSASGVTDAVAKAFMADRIAAFGGAVVVNRPLSLGAAEFLNTVYIEIVAAPAFEPGAVEVLAKRKNLRILELPALADLTVLRDAPFLDIKSLSDGGLVLQFSFRNRILKAEDFLPARAERDGKILLARRPDEREMDDLLFAWAVESGVTSNSVIFVRDGVTMAIGTGEQDRVGCVDITIHKAYTKFADRLCFERHGKSIYEMKKAAASDPSLAEALQAIQAETARARGGLPGSVLVSDGFFPFRDGVDLALEQGVTAIAQPGGSIRDFEVIQAVNEAAPQAAMVFTGQRSFRH